MTKNTAKPIAPSGFQPVNPLERMESAKPSDSDVVSGFYTTDRGLPWHVEQARQLGQDELMQGVARKLTAKEALAAAGADFVVETWPLLAEAPGDDPDRPVVEVPRRYATVRTDTNQALGVVGQNYRVLQNADAFAFADALVDDGSAKYETAGVLKGGARVFLSMEVPDDIVVAGDPSEYRLFLLFSNGHDGNTAARATITVERVVCRNTLRIAQHERAMATWAARHSGDMAGKVQAAREALGMSFRAAEAFAETASALVAKPLAQRQVDAILAQVFPLTEHQEERVAEKPEALDTLPLGMVRQVYADSPSIDPIRGTAYGVLSAVTEYMDHVAKFGGSVNSAEDVKAHALVFSNAAARDPKHVALAALREY